MTENLLLLDACACINLAAAFPLEELATYMGGSLRMVEQAASEAIFLYQEVDGKRVKTPINVGVIETLPLDGEPELELYVRLAKRLGDGEAASLSISHHRKIELVTDDRTARKVAVVDAPHAEIRGTAAILRMLTGSMGLSERDIAEAIRRVESRASFRPPHDDPEIAWWLSARETQID